MSSKRYRYLPLNRIIKKYKDNDNEGFLVARDVIKPGQDNPVKQFFYYKSIETFYKFYSRLKDEDRVYYDTVIEDQYRKMFFDIDCNKDNNPEGGSIHENGAEALKQIIKGVTKYLETHDLQVSEENYMICSSHSKDKCSYHLILTEYAFPSSKVLKTIYHETLKHVDEKYHRIIDPVPYRDSSFQFRMLFSTKMKQKRFKKIEGEHGLTDYELFQWCSIQYTEECGFIDDIPEYDPPKPEYNNDIDLSPAARELIEACLPAGYEINGEWSGGYTLIADDTARCPIHKNDEPPDKVPTHSKHPSHGSLIVTSKWIRFRCHQGPNSKNHKTIVICKTPYI